MVLQEWQFHLQTMFTLMCCWYIGKGIAFSHQIPAKGCIYSYFAQRCGVGRSTFINRSLAQINMMAWSQKKDMLIFCLRMDDSKSRSCRYSRKYITCMGYDNGLYMFHDRILALRETISHILAKLLGIVSIKTTCYCRFANLCFHHNAYQY